jgi:2-polyprenyl-3-methyl-5-hydroxy-6-metoxy-1,4-benzoquinol methylase
MNPHLLSPFHYFFPDLSTRWDGPELMDDQTGDQKALFTTLSNFKYVNTLLSSYTSVYNRYLLPEMLKQQNQKITIMDLGAGGCDIPLWIHSRCQQLGLNVTILCIDTDPRAVDFGKKVCAEYKEISVECADFFDLDLASLHVDYILSNHLLHHLDTNRMSDFLQRVNKGARRGFIMNDLCRSWKAYSLFTIFAGICFRKGFAFHDGRLSIRKSFTMKEIRHVIRESKLEHCVRIQPLFPFRYLLMSFNR